MFDVKNVSLSGGDYIELLVSWSWLNQEKITERVIVNFKEKTVQYHANMPPRVLYSAICAAWEAMKLDVDIPMLKVNWHGLVPFDGWKLIISSTKGE